MTFKEGLYVAAVPPEGISISPLGWIEFSSSFLKEHFVEPQRYAHLYWDSDSQAIAISLAEEEDPGAWRVTNSRNGSAHIDARQFFHANDLDAYEWRGQYPYAKLSDEESVKSGVPAGAFVIEQSKRTELN